MDQSSSRLNAEVLQIDPDNSEVTTKSSDDVLKDEQRTEQDIEAPQMGSSEEDNHKTSPLSAPSKVKDGSLTNKGSLSNPAAKSKIPSIKQGPNKSSLSLMNKNSPQVSTTQRSVQRTDTKISMAEKNTMLGKKTEEISTKRSVGTKPPITSVTRNRLIGPNNTKFQNRSASSLNSRTCALGKKEENEKSLRKIASTAGDHNKINILEKKLKNIQSEFFEALKQNPAGGKWKNEYKFITLDCNDECKLLVKDDYLKKMPQKLPVNSVGDFKEKIKTCIDENWATLNESPKLEESTQKLLQEIQDSSSKMLLKLVDDLCNSYKDDEYDRLVVNMQNDLLECKKALKIANTKLAEISKIHEEQLSILEKDLKSQAMEELSRKETEIKELKATMSTSEKKDLDENHHLQEELNAVLENFNALQEKLLNTEKLLSHEQNVAKEKNETIKRLETEGKVMSSKIKEYNEIKIKVENKSEELSRKISELRDEIHKVKTEKAALEKANAQLLSETSSNMDVLKKLQEAENRIRILQQQLIDRDDLKESQPECPKDMVMELAKLRQSEAEKRREIEKLKVELTKSIFNISQLENQIQRDQQLLEVRGELINSLQTNETNQRIHMEELFVQVGEKNSTISELNNELSAKSDEFRNLFTTINNKQLELSNQEHMIKLLEESNERSQLLRVKQEEKIGRMEEDIANLKQTISIYQANVLSTNGKLVFAPVMHRSSQDDCNENLFYYASERKRKRQIDINVKKYET